jgi:hypothetical protein
MTDYHKVLGVSRKASADEIRKAYRRLALLFHPDRNKDKGAEARFKEINQAYAILSGKEKEPDARPAPRQRGRGPAMTPHESWAYEVSRIWQEMEEEKHNNMYR